MKLFSLCLLLFSSFYLHAQDSGSGGNVIINIYNARPEQRTQSRWNLFDWMRTKEKIKMWDMWLAHNSTKNFLPEFAVAGYYTFSDIDNARANYYKLNIDSYFLGLKFADFGINLNGKFLSKPEARKDTNYSASGLFRIFGNNVRNSSIVAKVGYGHSEYTSAIFNNKSFSNLLTGGELQLYLIDHIGFKSSIDYFFKSTALNDPSISLSVLAYSYRGFVEYKSVRLEAGYYTERQTFNNASGSTLSKVSGWIIGIQQAL